MPRIRTIKPDFWSDSKMVKLSAYARLLYLGMWNFALCDAGHLPDDADELKLKILPADPVDADALVDELIKLDRIRRLQTDDGRSYLWVPRLDQHQKIDARWNTRCPYCAPTTSPSKPKTHPNSAEAQRDSPKLAGTQESTPSKGREGRGGESKGGKGGEGTARDLGAESRASDPNGSEPPSNCEEHRNTKTPGPCGACKDARLLREEWLAAKRERIDASPKCAQHTGELARNCRVCASEEKAGFVGRHAAFDEQTQLLPFLRAVPNQESA